MALRKDVAPNPQFKSTFSFFKYFYSKYTVLKTYTPISNDLQPFIEFFYVFNSTKPDQLSYIAFPHINTGFSFFKGVTISRHNYEITIEESTSQNHVTCMEVLGKYTRPVFVHYKGDFEEVAIVFKPLGINRFVKDKLIKLAPEYSQPFTLDHWAAFSDRLFKEKENRIAVLEEFLLSQLNPNDQLSLMDKALQDLGSNTMEYAVEEVAKRMNMSIKTFQRHFLDHLACTPSEFKRIAKFRHALNLKMDSTEIKSLTGISYDSQYSDQSYFIREFKKLSHRNPKQFFNTITSLEENKIIWELK